jgi:hypothetical protein
VLCSIDIFPHAFCLFLKSFLLYSGFFSCLGCALAITFALGAEKEISSCVGSSFPRVGISILCSCNSSSSVSMLVVSSCFQNHNQERNPHQNPISQDFRILLSSVFFTTGVSFLADFLGSCSTTYLIFSRFASETVTTFDVIFLPITFSYTFQKVASSILRSLITSTIRGI